MGLGERGSDEFGELGFEGGAVGIGEGFAGLEECGELAGGSSRGAAGGG